MPILKKQSISNFLRSSCERRLRLDLYPDEKAYQLERTAQNMPPESPGRPGLGALRVAGSEWEEDKLNDLVFAFGSPRLIGSGQPAPKGGLKYGPVKLDTIAPKLSPGSFVVQAEYTVGKTFRSTLWPNPNEAPQGLQFAYLRPDLIQVLPPRTPGALVLPDGRTLPVEAGDQRPQLRIIDIKLSAEPSPGYFAEIAYYSMALSAWLLDQKLDKTLAVSIHGAVWPGSHSASALRRAVADAQAKAQVLTLDQMNFAFDADLELVPFDVFSLRLRRFFTEDLPRVLKGKWEDLPWHVDNRCIGCEYLGFPWFPNQPSDPRHCYPMAKAQDHLSQIPFVSPGAGEALRESQVATAGALAQLEPHAKAFDSHHTLRATRTVISSRALALTTQTATVPPESGTSAVLPKWNDLAVYLSADFDIGSGITLAFGVEAFWVVPKEDVPAGTENFKRWKAREFVVEQRSTDREREVLLAFLAYMNEVLSDVRKRDDDATFQVYVWDRVQYEHLARVIGRHLAHVLAANSLKHLAWLFPPDEVVKNADHAQRQSPVTIVRDVVRTVVAAPVPHYYSLLNVARSYHEPVPDPKLAEFNVQAIFEDPFSDQIPSERAHEIWTKYADANRPWEKQLQWLGWTIATRLRALESVVRRLRNDLSGLLSQRAPAIKALGPPERIAHAAPDGQLWYAFAKLDAALQALDVHQTRAMPPHEREARFQSARLVRRLEGKERTSALQHFELADQVGRWIYELSEKSREAKVSEGDFSVALAPGGIPGFLDNYLRNITAGRIVPLPKYKGDLTWMKMELVCKVTVRGVDRDRLLVAVDIDDWWKQTVLQLDKLNLVDFRKDVILDPIPADHFTKSLKSVLGKIGAPPVAQSNCAVPVALGQKAKKKSKKYDNTPVSEVLWSAGTVANSSIARDVASARVKLDSAGLALNDSQWKAWAEALTHRCRLVWGPPGTGKSQTLTAVIAGAFADAAHRKVPLRVLLTAHTYHAIDEVLQRVHDYLFRTNAPLVSLEVSASRLRSGSKEKMEGFESISDVEVSRSEPSSELLELRNALFAAKGLHLVASTPQQIYNLLAAADGDTVGSLFDVIVIDEASQMDVAHSILALAALADGGAVVVAGDPLQLAPITKAEPPLDLEWMVGSVYEYLKRRHEVPEVMLETNYRSNKTIVGLAHVAGYGALLASRSPDLRLHLPSPIPSSQTPSDWPTGLQWSPEWATILDPKKTVGCFIYSDSRSSQWNDFEAQATAALLRGLYGHLGATLANELDPRTGLPGITSPAPFDPVGFWTKGVGVVTPHRAQQSLTITWLNRAFKALGGHEKLIRGAVDTVERFQGQQRDVIIATFALGDPDAIGDESEFLLSLNRFNVMASRARAKLVVLVTQQVIDHIANDIDVLRGSRLLKIFAADYCTKVQTMALPFVSADGKPQLVSGEFRYRE